MLSTRPGKMAIIASIINTDVYIEILDNFLISWIKIGLVITKSFFRGIMHFVTEQSLLSGNAFKINNMAGKQSGSKSR